MIYYFTHCKARKLLALFKSLVFPGDARLACVIKEFGLDISTYKFQHKNIKTLRSSYSYAYIYHGLYSHLALHKASYAHAYIIEPPCYGHLLNME